MDKNHSYEPKPTSLAANEEQNQAIRRDDAMTDAGAGAGAVVHFVGPRVGLFTGETGEKVKANKSMENSPGFLFNALGLPAVLPPPEEVKKVASAIGAVRAENQRDDMLEANSQ